MALDLFNRIASQTWTNYNTSSNVFQINHGYDHNSNRLYAQNTTQKGASQVYTYDQLNRLLTYKAGSIKSDFTDIAPNWTIDATRWTLDATGNQTAVDYLQRLRLQQLRLAELVPEHRQHGQRVSPPARARASPRAGCGTMFSSNTTANWSSPGSSVTFTVNTTAQTLTVNTVGQDTIDGVPGAAGAGDRPHRRRHRPQHSPPQLHHPHRHHQRAGGHGLRLQERSGLLALGQRHDRQ